MMARLTILQTPYENNWIIDKKRNTARFYRARVANEPIPESAPDPETEKISTKF